jgi:hypothetical protein
MRPEVIDPRAGSRAKIATIRLANSWPGPASGVGRALEEREDAVARVVDPAPPVLCEEAVDHVVMNVRLMMPMC